METIILEFGSQLATPTLILQVELHSAHYAPLEQDLLLASYPGQVILVSDGSVLALHPDVQAIALACPPRPWDPAMDPLRLARLRSWAAGVSPAWLGSPPSPGQ